MPTVNNTTSVSIGIPCFNESQNIPHILESIKHQKIKDGCHISEVIISDDSSDNTSALIRNHFKNNDLPYTLKLFHHNERRGEALALNEIMMAAKGDFLVLYEADTIPAKNTTSELITPLMNDEKVGISFANPLPTSSSGISSKAWNYLAHFLHMVRKNDGITRLGVTGRGIALRGSILKKLTIPKWVNSASDLYLPCRVIEMGYKTYYASNGIVYFRPDATINDFCLHVLKSWIGHYKLNKYASKHMPIKSSFLINFKRILIITAHFPIEALSLFLAILSIPLYAPQIIKKVHTPQWAISKSTKRYPFAKD